MNAKATKPVLPKGVRDFSIEETARRRWMLQQIQAVFSKYGFSELMTPAFENLSVLQGKYGEEGDQLLFKLVRNGDFMAKVQADDLEKGSKGVLAKIAEKGLRYDLTVPFARYVSANWSELPKPFKRYAIQPVYRADRPQKGRYQEFYQCDVDVAGTDSLLCEAEMIGIFEEALTAVGLTHFSIKWNHRGLLTAIQRAFAPEANPVALFTLIDKLDKKPFEDLLTDFEQIGVKEPSQLQQLLQLNLLDADGQVRLPDMLAPYSEAQEAVAELNQIVQYLQALGIPTTHLELDLHLARGLSYYTGCIFEVKAHDVQIGSMAGGGRYANLTENFGLRGYSGVGISFGVDRLYDVLTELDQWPAEPVRQTVVLIALDTEGFTYSLKVVKHLREAGIACELYPTVEKLKKPMSYVNKAGTRYILLAGSNEIEQNAVSFKDLSTGKQELVPNDELVQRLKAQL